jgi:hypothetical protein
VLIKIILIAAVLLLGAGMLRGQGKRRQALRRIGLVVFAVVAVTSILQPDYLTWVAQRINVGRGADLLLYALIVVFFSYIATRYRRDTRTQEMITAISRRVALNQAPPPRPPDTPGQATPDRPDTAGQATPARPDTAGQATPRQPNR